MEGEKGNIRGRYGLLCMPEITSQKEKSHYMLVWSVLAASGY